VFVEHATHSGPAQSAVCSLIMGGSEAPAMRPSVDLRATFSPSRQAEHEPDCTVFAGDLTGRAGPGGQHGQQFFECGDGLHAVAGWGPVRKYAVGARRARGASPG
jgi:hypothetical protein